MIYIHIFLHPRREHSQAVTGLPEGTGIVYGEGIAVGVVRKGRGLILVFGTSQVGPPLQSQGGKA